nr:hypothetical protein [Tanacetum cinerariifolium]
HRAHLPEWADQYYRFLAHEVDVVGGDGPEEFEVLRQNDAQTQVTVYELPRAGQRGAVRYQRTFRRDETREIRLYGQGGVDVFVLRGEVQNGPVQRRGAGPARQKTLVDEQCLVAVAGHGPEQLAPAGARLRQHIGGAVVLALGLARKAVGWRWLAGFEQGQRAGKLAPVDT